MSPSELAQGCLYVTVDTGSCESGIRQRRVQDGAMAGNCFSGQLCLHRPVTGKAVRKVRNGCCRAPETWSAATIVNEGLASSLPAAVSHVRVMGDQGTLTTKQ